MSFQAAGLMTLEEKEEMRTGKVFIRLASPKKFFVTLAIVTDVFKLQVSFLPFKKKVNLRPFSVL